VDPAGDAAADVLPEPQLVRGSETILLVEDEATVRSFARRTLEGLGYRVLAAGDGRQALAAVSGHPGRIDVLMTDVMMPGMQGTELAERLASLRPGIRVLFASGFSGNTAFGPRKLPPDMAYLPKPYSSDSLARAVRTLLDGRS
jgi:CheY-like chemotaxis protein